MKRLLTGALLLLAATQSDAAVIANWTFETNTPADLTDSATIGPILADVGTGTASGAHWSSLTDWTTPSGNGSANSLSSNNWGVGDYYQFSVATTGFEDLVLSWAQTSSGTGPGEFMLAYQVNGGGFTGIGTYTVLSNQAGAPGLGTWGGSEILGYNFSVNLSHLTDLDNAAAVDFRLVMWTTADSTPGAGASDIVATTGTSRVDNFAVSANAIAAVPEPASIGMFSIALAIGAIGARFRRKRAA